MTLFRRVLLFVGIAWSIAGAFQLLSVRSTPPSRSAGSNTVIVAFDHATRSR